MTTMVVDAPADAVPHTLDFWSLVNAASEADPGVSGERSECRQNAGMLMRMG